MRSLTPTESRLLILFAGALFIMANLFGLKYGMRARAKLTRDTAALESRISEDRSWMILAEDFVEPRQWLAANPPPVFAADAASTELIRVVRGGTEAQGLTMTEESLLPAEGAAGYPNVNLQCKLSGAFPGLVHLLFELQKPGAWRSSRQRRSRLTGILLIAALVYAILLALVAGDFAMKLMRLGRLRAEAAYLEVDAAAAREEILRWRQIRNAVDPQAYALDLLAAVAEQLQGDQIRLTMLSIEPGRLAVAGEARDVSQAYQFIEKVKHAPALADFDWNASQPELAGKQNVRFTMEGKQPDAQPDSH